MEAGDFIFDYINLKRKEEFENSELKNNQTNLLTFINAPFTHETPHLDKSLLFSIVKLNLKTDCIRPSKLAGRTIMHRERWDGNEFWITKHVNNTLNRWTPTSTSCAGSGARRRLVVKVG